MELRSAAMHFCLVVVSQETLGFAAFQTVPEAPGWRTFILAEQSRFS
jgi:hypothetical protein